MPVMHKDDVYLQKKFKHRSWKAGISNLVISLISLSVDLGVLFVFEFELRFRFICFPSLSLSLLCFLV